MTIQRRTLFATAAISAAGMTHHGMRRAGSKGRGSSRGFLTADGGKTASLML